MEVKFQMRMIERSLETGETWQPGAGQEVT